MKKYMKSLKKVMVILAFGAVFSACEKYTEGVSEFDPTQPVDASLGQVVNSAEVAYIGFMEGELARIAGMWSSQFTGSDRQYVQLNNYTSTAPDYDNAWGNIYAGALKGFRIAEEKATTANNKRALAMMQILEAHTMVTTASVFGDIPYSQSNDLVEFPNPAFDKQLDVYNASLLLLNNALANIATAAAGTAYDGDIFGGDDASWIAVANTIKAKIYLHLGQYDNAITAANVGITEASLDLIASHGDIYQANFNIYSSFMDYDRPGYLSAADALAPRLLDPSADEYRGHTGKTNEADRFSFAYTTAEIYVAGYEPNFLSDAQGYKDEPAGMFAITADFPLVTYRENQLILAEATLRTGDASGALSALNNYRAYLDGGGYLNPDFYSGEGNYLAYTLADDFEAGGDENPDGIDAKDALYREIIEEKYISMIGTIEVFNDMRRNGFGSFAGKQNWQVIGITPNSGSQIPQRFIISQAEINSNTSAPTPTPGLFEKTEIFK